MTELALRAVSGAGQGMEIAVEHALIVGRDEGGIGNLKGDAELSRRHARFSVTPEGALVVEDLESTNGTFVNGRRITGPRSLHEGDRVALGATTLEVVAAAGDPEITAKREKPLTPGQPADETTEVRERPRASDPPAARRRGHVLPLVAGLLVLAGALFAVGYLVGHRGQVASATTAAAGEGTVYVESNIAKPNQNSVIALRYGAGGDLHPLHIADYPTGGAGSADLTDSGVLDADQHLLLDRSRDLLFAVNQGSDTIAVFHVDDDGSLQAADGSPFPSGGKAPVSVGVLGDTVIVANKAQDGVRDLAKVAPAYVTFHLNPDGSLTQFGPTIHALPGSSPTDALVAPDYGFVMSAEEGGPFRAFIVNSHGLTQGANSPLQPDSSIFPPGLDPSKRWGLGIAAYPSRPIVYIGMATVNKLAVYTYDAEGNLAFMRAVDARGAQLPCWTHVTPNGRWLYTANAGNNTMSAFDLSDPLNPRWIQTIALHGTGNPWDFQIDPSGRMIFLVDPRARMNVAPGGGQAVHTLLIGSDGRLSEPAYSPVPLPVALDVNPFGMAVLPGA